MSAAWMRPVGLRVAHAFHRVELRELHSVSALRWCGTWPVAELEKDEFAKRCRLCQVAVDELERESPEGESL